MHTTDLIESFLYNVKRLESSLYKLDGCIESTKENLAKLRLDYAEAQKIVAAPFPHQEELDSKEQQLKILTDELNQATIKAKKNAPHQEKTSLIQVAKYLTVTIILVLIVIKTIYCLM